MMKKVIATALCLTITAPCFAAGRYKNYYPNPNRMDCPRYEQGYDCRRDNHRLPRPDCRLQKYLILLLELQIPQ